MKEHKRMTEMPPTPRALTLEDVQKLVGSLMLEIDQLRRENALLRAELTQSPVMDHQGSARP
jgi:hypothetical protein